MAPLWCPLAIHDSGDVNRRGALTVDGVGRRQEGRRGLCPVTSDQ